MAVVKFTIFHGYPAELIAEWCGITLDTARLYKAGQRKPSRTVLRLFTLHRDGRVLGPAWEGWVADRDTITDPDGNTTTVRQLGAYAFVMQLAAALAAKDPVAADEFRRLLRLA